MADLVTTTPTLPVATTLADAWEVLDPRPLEFDGQATSGARFYAPPPDRFDDGIRVPGPMEIVRHRLLGSAATTKVFLSGHVGSGKSTQIRKLAIEEAVSRLFVPIVYSIEEAYRAQLDAAQLLFLLAARLFEYGDAEGLLSKNGVWRKVLGALDAALGGPSPRVESGTASVSVNVLFAQLKADLKVVDGRRKQFRELGETRQTLLIDLVAALVEDIQQALARKGAQRSLLLLIDDLDKVRGVELQDDIFRTNLNVLFAIPVRVLYTVPTGVAFDRCPAALRNDLVHIYPIQLLRKAPNTFDPEQALDPTNLGFFSRVLQSRVVPGLFDEDAIRLAAACSGGVLRSFFRILRAGIEIARLNEFPTVDRRTMRVAIKNERLNETKSLNEPEYRALSFVHRTHSLGGGADGSYLDYSWVIECYNDKVWYEANPLFWHLLRPEAA